MSQRCLVPLLCLPYPLTCRSLSEGAGQVILGCDTDSRCKRMDMEGEQQDREREGFEEERAGTEQGQSRHKMLM